jgi:hypothetical protein
VVKKSSFLEKLRNRFSSSPVQVSTGTSRTGSSGAGSSGAKASPGGTPKAGGRVGAPQSEAPSPAVDEPKRPAASTPKPRVTPEVERDPVVEVPDLPARPIGSSARKMSRQEEAQLVLEKGVAGLSEQLRSLQSRLEAPAQQLARLPEISQAQLEALRAVVDRLERQETTQARLERNLSVLPETLDGVRQALERAAATDARTAQTVEQFKEDMARIQTSMGELVEHNRGQSEATREAVTRGAGEAAQVAERFTKQSAEFVKQNQEGVEALRRTQAAQTERLEKVARDGQNAQRALVGVLAAVFVALAAIAGILLFR